MMPRFWRSTFCLLFLLTGWTAEVEAAAFEKYLMVFPLRPRDENSRQHEWFGQAFRTVWSQTSLSLRTLVFLKDDELASLQAEYHLGMNEPDPGQMETIADDKDISLLYGDFQIKGSKIVLRCHLISGRNSEAKNFQVEGSKDQLQQLFSQTLKNAFALLELTVTDKDFQGIQTFTGTNHWEAFRCFHTAYQLVQAQMENGKTCQQAMPWLNKAIQFDRNFYVALALRAHCQLTLIKSYKGKTTEKQLEPIRRDVAKAAAGMPENPIVMNTQVEWLLFQHELQKARVLSETNLQLHPANYHNYLLLGTIDWRLKMLDEAEKIFRRGLEQ